MDDDVRELAEGWRAARRELERVATELPVNADAWRRTYDAEKAAERAYFELLRDGFGWTPPHGVELD